MPALHKKVKEIYEVINEAPLTEWEIKFIQSMNVLVQGSFTLSEKQIEQIDRIYEKVCNWDEPVRRTK